MEWDTCLFKTLESKQTATACCQSYCCCSFLCSQPPGAGCQRGVMGFWKFPPFLVLSILVLYQAGMFHAAPFRSVFDGRFDPATLDEEESRLLLAAMVNDYEQMRARESEKAQKTEGSRPFLFLYAANQHPEESLQHCHLHDPSPGRLAEQIWEYGEEQLAADQDGFQDLQWAPQELLVLNSEMTLGIRSPGS
ncbi:uncharacterized protein LOC113905704 isoform X1 [Bos indicus x Bos taurus]|nr:uncharacterized protein LOC113905704 isoform X1 [Bos indicus x Bos taurus]XP_027419152.1 uncharacterized protein LOC113905704 isoform X1 [Bos indicus x Bos taurus]XP_027419154.1 uncharacterized protein LOC113905704 isoform X1 [Bos indicus x Bos taurus]